MSVGLLDADLYQHGAVPFNIDLMKLSSYYKKNRELVSLTQYFCPEKYTKYEVRKDIFDNDFRGFDLSNPKVNYGGLGFSSGNYIPLEFDIEKNIPDVGIYNKMEKYFLETKLSKELFFMMLKASHIRLSRDGVNIWEDSFKYCNSPLTPYSNSLFIHDTNLSNIINAQEYIEEYIGKKTIHIQNKFPIISETDEQFLKWYRASYLGEFNTFQHYGVLSDYCINEIVLRSKARATRVEYFVVDYNTNIQDFVSNQLSKILMQAVFLWNNQRIISLKYIKNILPSEKLERFLDLINTYIRYSHLLQFEKTLYDFIKLIKWRCHKKLSTFGFSVEELREVMAYIRDYCPETFDLCYSISRTEFKGDKIING